MCPALPQRWPSCGATRDSPRPPPSSGAGPCAERSRRGQPLPLVITVSCRSRLFGRPPPKTWGHQKASVAGMAPSLCHPTRVGVTGYRWTASYLTPRPPYTRGGIFVRTAQWVAGLSQSSAKGVPHPHRLLRRSSTTQVEGCLRMLSNESGVRLRADLATAPPEGSTVLTFG